MMYFFAHFVIFLLFNLSGLLFLLFQKKTKKHLELINAFENIIKIIKANHQYIALT